MNKFSDESKYTKNITKNTISYNNLSHEEAMKVRNSQQYKPVDYLLYPETNFHKEAKSRG